MLDSNSTNLNKVINGAYIREVKLWNSALHGVKFKLYSDWLGVGGREYDTHTAAGAEFRTMADIYGIRHTGRTEGEYKT